MEILKGEGKTVTEFTGIMSNPTYAKVQEGARLERENHIAPAQFARFAVNVWGVDPAGKTEEETALAGIEALADFIREIGLPTSFTEMHIPADTDYKAITESTILTGGCCKKLTAAELLEILEECK